MGKIQRCPESTQLRFIRLCCLYWNKECSLSYSDAEIEIDKEHIDILLSKKVIEISDNYIIIKFLNEQLEGITETSQLRREAVKKRWDKHKSKNSSDIQTHTNVLQNDTDKSRLEEKREEEKREDTIPDWIEFLVYAKEKEPSVNESALKNKYDAWVANGWKDGNNNQVKNWKSKILQTMPYIKKDAAAVTKFEIPKYIP